jgi:hypothetical protein
MRYTVMVSMAVELTPLGKFTKWIVAPVFAGLVGYGCVAPALNEDVAKRVRRVPGLGNITDDSLSNARSDKASNFRSIR